MVKIDKNIPIPEKEKRGPRRKYPWFEMQIGDSFFVSKPKFTCMRTLVAITNKRYKNLHFETRKEANGCRIWRTK